MATLPPRKSKNCKSIDLYVGTYNSATGGEVWRSSNGTTWNQVNTDGFGNANNRAVAELTVLHNDLYAAVGNWTAGAEVRKTSNGTTWNQISSGGFGDSDSVMLTGMAVFGNNLYAAAYNEDTSIEVWLSLDTIGTTGVPYVTDNDHFNAPCGIAVDGSGNIVFVEERGHRPLKLNSSGAAQWVKGEAGIAGSDNNHFSWACGAAVDASGNIYVADTWNHRAQTFNGSGTWQARLGITGVAGSDNAHFNGPRDVAVDASGNIYVADTENHRKVQQQPHLCGYLGSDGLPWHGQLPLQLSEWGSGGW